MFYYAKMTRELSVDMSKLVLSSTGDPLTEIEIEFFGRVTFSKAQKDKTVGKMSGNWFDLNGNASRLMAILDEKKISDIKGESFQPLPLSKVPIHQSNFDADMGPVEFYR